MTLVSDLAEAARTKRPSVPNSPSLDFGRLLALQRGTPTQCYADPDTRCPIHGYWPLVVNALNAARAHLDAGALVTVDPVRHRIRLLPLESLLTSLVWPSWSRGWKFVGSTRASSHLFNSQAWPEPAVKVKPREVSTGLN